MRVILPGGICAEWTPEEAADAIRRLTDALLAEAVGVPAMIPQPATGQLRDFLDSPEADVLTPGMRTALQMILRHGSVPVGDLAEIGVFRCGRQPPSVSAIKSFRTRVNGILIDAGLALAYSEADHLLRVAPI